MTEYSFYNCMRYRWTVSSEISDLCEITDLLFFVSYFTCQKKRAKFGDYFLDVCCINQNFLFRFQIPTTSYSTEITITTEKYWT